MTRYISKRIAIAALLFLSLTSCLKEGLPEFENWELNEINNVYIEHRYESGQLYYGEPIVAYQRLNVSQSINAEANRIELTVSVPAANGSFTQAVREQVSQNQLWIYMDISTAAKIAPVGGSPKLGDPIDLTRSHTYEVTAANGDKRIWTIEVVSFTK